MALNERKMQGDLYKAMEASDAEVAGKLKLDDWNTDQKKIMRWEQAKAIASWIYSMLTSEAEVDLDKLGPQHPPPSSVTGPGGGPPHTHPTNAGPITHKKGNFIV